MARVSSCARTRRGGVRVSIAAESAGTLPAPAETPEASGQPLGNFGVRAHLAVKGQVPFPRHGRRPEFGQEVPGQPLLYEAESIRRTITLTARCVEWMKVRSGATGSDAIVSDNIWGYQSTANYSPGAQLTGFRVEATDGSVGKVDRHSDQVDSSYLVVDTGMWIFGKHVLLPAGTITTIDPAEQKVYVGLTKEQIKDAPEFDKEKHLTDPDHRRETG